MAREYLAQLKTESAFAHVPFEEIAPDTGLTADLLPGDTGCQVQW
ncbi:MULTISPECIES: hypothetical protein [unclassified Streptomyces]|nr:MULTISPECIES: hypothetical protein [Streptomyces]